MVSEKVKKRAVITFAGQIPLISFFGMLVEKPLENSLLTLGAGWPSPPLLGRDDIQALWLGFLAVHGAIAAIAPVLGFTLLTTAATPSTRLAPAGFVVADSIEWKDYLLWSLTLLAGSVVAVAVVPSLLGLAAASAATVWVIVATLKKFWYGFYLLGDEAAFDKSARKYLKDAVLVNPEEPILDAEKRERLNELNNWIEKLPKIKLKEGNAIASLYVGQAHRQTELLSISADAGRRLQWAAQRNGAVLLQTSVRPSADMGIGARPLLSLTLGKLANLVGDEPLDPAESENPVALENARANLQRVLDGVIVYGEGEWTSSQVRIPLLLTRHLAATLYEAIPNHRPHDLVYGLNVLGELIDDATTSKKRELIGPPANRWVYDTPAYLTKQLCDLVPYDTAALMELVSFLRERIALWISNGYIQSARAYLSLIERILSRSARQSDQAVEAICVYLREMPFLITTPDTSGVRVIARSLVISVVDERISADRFKSQRSILVRTLLEMIEREKYRRGENALVLKLEACACLLGAALLLSAEKPSFSSQPRQIYAQINDPHFGASFDAILLLDIASNIGAVVDKWRLDWWEMDMRERGRAHVVTIETWCMRAIAVLMSSRPWQLRSLPDSSAPGLDVIGAIKRAVGDDWAWLGKIDDALSVRMRALIDVLDELQARREVLQEQRVLEAQPDISRCEAYVQEVSSNVGEAFGPHDRWLRELGFSTFSEANKEAEANISFLVPKESFIDQELLDISSIFLSPSLGQDVVNFEIKKIGERLMSGPVESVANERDQRIWDAGSALFKEHGNLLVLVYGISEYELSDMLEKLNSGGPDAKSDIRVQFVHSDDSRGAIVFATQRSFSLARYSPAETLNAIASAVVCDAVAVDIAPVSQNEMEEWTLNDPEANVKKQKLANSLVSRVHWKFDVLLGALDCFRSFSFPISSDSFE